MAIDIGGGAINRAADLGNSLTIVDLNNPANATGILDVFEVQFDTDESVTGLYMGTFSGSSTTYTSRDSENIGTCSTGSKQTFTGKNCSVTSGDFIGYFTTTGRIERATTGGSGIYYKSGNLFGAGAQTYTLASSNIASLYATGYTSPTVTTQDASSVSFSSCTGNGNITDTGGASVTRRGFCYLEGTTGDPTTSDSVAYDDGTFTTGAYTKAIAGLKFGTGYRVRAYAVNSIGTSYGTTVQVTTNVIQIVVSGLFKSVSAISVLVGGVWKSTKPNLLVGGTWK